ncbi:hypothetical protein GCM10022261_11790 [Brevibacterium daeguense]|uniref:Acyl-CoA synthetase (AMP-forming)/AMP-acid ligase II n=1 Tax=Brevibacterium daeguense TaxID=909936 RepID=A0ABP8EI64_9MICO|nr:fatty acid--CoA ligase family protein [Brevibacterium daeguense]
MPFTQKVLDIAASDVDQLAIVGAEERLTYAELVPDSQRACAAAAHLHAAQDQPPVPAPETEGIPVTAISLASAFHTARLIGGLAGFRTVTATIDPRWPLDHQVRLIAATGIGLVISDSPELAEALRTSGWTGTVVTLAEFRRLERDLPPAAPPTARAGAEPFLMLFSSGTTDNPKAFIKTRQQYRDNFAVSSAHLEPLPGVATLAPGPVSYSLTLYALVECLASGGSCHVADRFDPIAAGRRIQAEAITRVVAVPAAVQGLTDAARRDPQRFTTLDLVVTGGANLSAAIRSNFAEALPDARLISYYGAAEIGFIGDSRGGDGTLITIYDGIEVSIRGPEDPEGSTTAAADDSPAADQPSAELPDGELGTVWIRARACSYGYVAATTDARLVGPDGFATVHDQGRVIDGRLSLAGRAGDIVVTGGHTVSLPEVERAFETMPGLGEVCAVGLPSPQLGTVVALVIEGAPPPKAELLAHGRAHLAPQYVPRRWFSVLRLPRTVGGKVRRGATAELVHEDHGVTGVTGVTRL